MHLGLHSFLCYYVQLQIFTWQFLFYFILFLEKDTFYIIEVKTFMKEGPILFTTTVLCSFFFYLFL